MGATAIDYRTIQQDERKTAEPQSQATLLTPARRAALEALEREFHDLLRAHAPA